MGQAKRRGSAEERLAQAKKVMREKFPESVTCNNCQATLSEIEGMDVRGLEGMRLAGQAHCEACDQVTWVVDGTQEGLKLFQRFMSEQSDGAAPKIGRALRP